MKLIFNKRLGQKQGTNILHLFWTRRRKKELLRALQEIPKGSEILDAGCGEGTFTELLFENGYKAVGVDISGTAVDRASRRRPEIVFRKASLESEMLFFKDGIFSAVYCSEVLEHLFDVHAALKNFNRILREKGLLILTIPYHGILKNLFIFVFGFERHYDPYSQHIRFFTLKSLSACLENAGFCVERSSGIGRLWPFHMSLFAKARKIGPAKEDIGVLG